MTKRTSRRTRLRVESLEGRQLLTAGALDTTFGGTGQVITSLSQWSEIGQLAVQPDLKTVVVGLEEVVSNNGSTNNNLVLVRYNVDGSLDSTFGNGGEVVRPTQSSGASSVSPASVAIQADGKIDVATNTATFGNGNVLTSCDMLVLQFNPNGTLETSFGQNGETDIHLPQGMAASSGIAVLTSGQIVVAGTNAYEAIGPEYVVARLTSSGALDTTFGPNGQGYNYTTIAPTTGLVRESVNAVGVDSSGDILLGGTWMASSSSPWEGQVVRYTPNGLIDTSFANQGILDLSQHSRPAALGFQSNGQIILGFSNGVTSGGEIARFNPNGTLDTTFGSDGYFNDPDGDSSQAIAVQPDDKILTVDAYSSETGSGVQVDRLLPGGALDPSFGTGGRSLFLVGNYGGPGGNIVVGPNGKITGGLEIGGPSDYFPAFGAFRLLGDPVTTGQIVVTQQPPASLVAGTPFGLSVEVEDNSGNLESSYNGAVTVGLASGPDNSSIGGTLTVTASNGVATFSGLSLTKAATGYTLLVTGTSLADAITTATTVSPSTASQVVFTQEPPTSVTAGAGFSLQASVEDPYGNVVTTANNTVTLALASNPVGATLGGTLTETASNGVASFSGLTLTKAATGYTFQVSSSGLSGSASTALSVTAAAASGLLITQQPSSVVVNTGFTLVVEIVDAYGNLVTSANNSVTIALGNNPTGAKLSGTLTATAKNGVVTFSGLKLNKIGTGYTLLISSKNLTGATSGPIAVT